MRELTQVDVWASELNVNITNIIGYFSYSVKTALSIFI